MNVGDVDIHYRVYGRGAPVLLVHGFPLSGEMWDGVVARIRDGYRLIVPELRGHGRSGSSPEASMGTYAADLRRVLVAAREDRPVVLVGLSMGGYVAFEFYRRYERRVRALVLADTRAAADSADTARDRRETAERVLREGSSIVADRMAEKLFAPSAAPELREEWRRRMAATDPAGVAAALRAMAERTDSRRLLKRIRRPVLVVVGAEDAITEPAEARGMAEAIPGARLKVIPGAGHVPPVERPAEFAAALRRFIEHLPAGRAFARS